MQCFIEVTYKYSNYFICRCVTTKISNISPKTQGQCIKITKYTKEHGRIVFVYRMCLYSIVI